MKIKLIISLLILLYFGCNRTPNPPFSLNATVDCHRGIGEDSSRVAEALIGSWEWQFVSCFAIPNEANANASSGLVVNFSDNGTLVLREADGTESTAIWELEPVGRVRGLRVEPNISELNGRIWVCGDKLVFNDSYRDGCDNFFRRE